MLGSGLAEAGGIRRDRDIAGRADFLAAGDADAVAAVDHRLVANQDVRDHVVEQAHVLFVFLRVARIILRVLFGIASGAEGLIADGGEDDGHAGAVHRGLAEGEDRFFHHSRGIGVELFGVVENDPVIVQAFDGAAVIISQRSLFDQKFFVLVTRDNVMIHNHIVSPLLIFERN